MNIIEELKKHRAEITKKFTVRKIGVFGSYARGEQKEISDVDILVEFDKPTFDNFMDLVFFLEELLGKKVELVTTKALSPYISPFVKQEVVWCE